MRRSRFGRRRTLAALASVIVNIQPKILYFGTPVVLLSTENADGTANLAPMSSAWALGQVVVLGLGAEGQTARNLLERPDVVINVPGPALWEAARAAAQRDRWSHPIRGRRTG